jgi:small subunit ribosomal protein S17
LLRKKEKNKVAEQVVKNKRTLQGTVVSSAMDKTIVVRVDTRKVHPLYEKVVTRSTKLKAHDENEVCNLGDTVIIQECRPLSKTKSWMLVEVVEKAL